MSILSTEERARIIAQLVEGTGIRGTARLCGANKTTVNKLSLELGKGCLALHNELVRDVRVALVQVDEQWSFVKKKQKRMKPTDDPETTGDQWTYLAQDVTTRVVLSFLVGRRTSASAREFVTDLRGRVLGRFQVTADGHKPYVDAFLEICGDTVDFAQLVKRYECDEREAKGLPLGRKWYIGSEKTAITGNPNPKHTSTSRIERTNLSNRMEQARFARKTLRHSKDITHHRASAALYYAYYNLCRVHQTLRTTPAVVLGITPREWSLGELIEVAMDHRPRASAKVEVEALDAAIAPVVLRVLAGGKGRP